MSLQTPIYLDHHATTPLDPRVLEILQRTQRDHFGNPASANHAFGWAAAKLVEGARAEVAELIGAQAREIVFTSGATEANNLALKGVATSYRSRGGHFVTSVLEHEAVIEPLADLQREGFRLSTVGVGTEGIVAAEAIAAALGEDTLLVSLIAAQNEIGTLQPLREVGRLCRERGVLLHTDAAQAAGKIPLDVDDDGIDLLSLSSHKLYGPKGVGALFVRRRRPRVKLTAQQSGGGQEHGLRAGTLNVPGIVAFGAACRLAGESLVAEAARLRRLRERLWANLDARLSGVHLHGDRERRLPGNLNLSFAGIAAHRLLASLRLLAVSSSSACTSSESSPSRILKAIGVPDELASASLRIGLGRWTSEAEVDFAADKIVEAVTRLRAERVEH